MQSNFSVGPESGAPLAVQLVLPAVLEDETLSSLLVRMGRINGVDDMSMISTRCFGESNAVSFINSSVNFPLFCSNTGEVYGNASAVLETLTLLPTHMKLGGISHDSIASIEQGRILPSLSSLTFDGLTSLAFCPKCVEHDLRRVGMTHWRRLHQLCILQFCPRHREKLIRVSVSRDKLHNSFPLPGDTDLRSEGSPVWVEGAHDFWLGVLAVVSELLEEYAFPEPAIIFQTLADEAERRGLLSRGRLLRRFVAFGDLCDVLGVSSSDISPRHKKLLDRMLNSLLMPSKGCVMGRAVFIHWFFGSWKNFKAQCLWNAVFEKVIPIREACDGGSSDRQRLGKHYRSACITFKTENPECTRADFLVADYKSFRWLLHNDKQWLEQELPSSSKRRVQLPLF